MRLVYCNSTISAKQKFHGHIYVLMPFQWEGMEANSSLHLSNAELLVSMS